MKIQSLWKILPTTLIISLGFSSTQAVNAQMVEISANFQPDPMVMSGRSGGNQTSNCGNISSQPSQIIEVKESLPYLRVTLQGSQQSTLLIDGPGGRFCVMPDNYSGKKPEISGFWQAGRYRFYIGELSSGQSDYTLFISQQKSPVK
ncbi:hypothetical protein IJ00_15650 [Calothrix sp. 336/3]|nr:hypothetical protein [Calothrix sp. 336/3]AKG24668.1 hypothetical protein IJ00_15650 [Calothrix sp. 336/3]